MGAKVALLCLLVQFVTTGCEGRKCLPTIPIFGTKARNQFYRCDETGLAHLEICPDSQIYSSSLKGCADPKESDPEDPVDEKVLGRALLLGALYDARKSILYPEVSLWTEKTIMESLRDGELPSTNTAVRTDKSVKERLSHMEINAQLQISFLGGLVTVTGSGGYLKDEVARDNEVNVELIYDATKHFQTLPVNTPLDYPELCSNSRYTHVVTSITYGMGAYFVFKRLTQEYESEETITGSLAVSIDKIPGFSITGEGSVNLTEEERSILDSTTLKMYGDFAPQEPIPSNFDEAISFYKHLPLLCKGKESGYEGCAPVNLRLTPVTEFCTDADFILNSISDTIVSQTTDMIDGLERLAMRVGGLLAMEPTLRFAPLKKNLNIYRVALQEFTLGTKRMLQELLPQILGGDGHGEEDLLDLILAYKDSQFEFEKSSEFLSNREREIAAISVVLKNFPEFSNCAVVDYENANDVDFIFTKDKVVILEFNVLSLPEVTLSFLNGSLVDESDSWFNDIFINGRVGVTIRDFASFAQANVDLPDRGYLINIKPLQDEPIHVTSLVNGVPAATEFTVPDGPGRTSVVRAGHNFFSVELALSSTWVVGATFSVTNVISGLVRHLEVLFTPADRGTVVVDVYGVEIFTAYQYEVQFLTEVGKTVFGDTSDILMTAPASPPHHPIVSGAGLNSFTVTWNPPETVSQQLVNQKLTYRIRFTGNNVSEEISTTDLSYHFNNLREGTEYRVNISAVFGSFPDCFESLALSEAVYTTPVAPNFQLAEYDESIPHSVRLRWNQPQLPSSAEVFHYRLEYRSLPVNKTQENGTAEQLLEEIRVNSTEVLVTGLAKARVYSFQVGIVTSTGSSQLSQGCLVKTSSNQTDLDNMRKELMEEIQGLAKRIDDEILDLQEQTTLSSGTCAMGYYEAPLTVIGNVIYEQIVTEVDNVGNSLDINTGVFTTNRAGLYEVTASGMCDSVGDGLLFGGCRFTLQLNGSLLDNNFITSSNFNTKSNYDSVSRSQLLFLEAGDTIQLRNEPYGNANMRYVNFCVHLVHQAREI